MMKKCFKYRFIYLFFIIFMITGSVINAQVYEPELENLGPVEFINYEGPHTRIETRAQIRSIGYSLGIMIRNGQSYAGGAGRYFVIHSESGADGSKLDADIFGLGVDVGVDHVRNLRLIIQGYLEAAYSYSERDAALLAEYITIYNAVHRGDHRYFDSRYKKAVMDNITPERAGLSIRYDEWPGRTLMVIPLGPSSAGPLSSVSTTPLTEPQITDQLRQQPDMGIDTRRDMVDLMERQSEEAAQQAQIQREAIIQDEQRLAEERRRSEEQQQQAAEQQRQAQEQQRQAQEQQRQADEQQRQAQAEQERIARERQEEEADQRALDQRQQEAERLEREAEEQRQQAEEQQRQAEEQQRQAEEQQRQAEERQRELEQQQREVEERRQEAEQIDQYSEQKADEAQQERREIAGDQQAVIDQEDLRPLPTTGILGATILSQNSSLGRIVKINPDNGQEVRRSALNSINARSITILDGRLFAIAGEARGDGAIRLIEINTDTLEMLKQGDDDISPQSLIWVNGNDLYAITSSGSNFYLTRFDTELVRQARSSMTVHPFASVNFGDGFLVTQRADGTAVLLNIRELTEKR